MKKFIFILGIVVLAGGIFYGGMELGIKLQMMDALLQVSAVDKALIDAAQTSMRIFQLEEGKVDDLKSFLNMELDGDIITLGQLSKDYPNDVTRQHAGKVLARIAKYRQEHPVRSTITNQVPGYAAVEMRVQEILTEALQEGTKQNQPPDRTR